MFFGTSIIVGIWIGSCTKDCIVAINNLSTGGNMSESDEGEMNDFWNRE